MSQRPPCVPDAATYLELSYQYGRDGQIEWRVFEGAMPPPQTGRTLYLTVNNNTDHRRVPYPDLGAHWMKGRWEWITVHFGDTVGYMDPGDGVMALGARGARILRIDGAPASAVGPVPTRIVPADTFR